jgi:hypothetical protein
VRGLSASELLRVWERGAARHPAERALSVLASANPDVDRAALAALPLGERDRLLSVLRIGTFGPAATGRDECSRCGVEVEFAIPIEALADAPPPAEHEIAVELAGGPVYVRLPTSQDLLAVADLDEEAASRELATRCLVSPEDRLALDEPSIQRIGEALEALDPLAVTTMRVACVACGHAWERALEIGAFFWEEIAAAARRLLYEVAALAGAWGWSERDILAMSPRRRQTYLAMVTG